MMSSPGISEEPVFDFFIIPTVGPTKYTIKRIFYRNSCRDEG